ncbi:hypothetical protein ACA910_008420 [Epithemia clementina (nom. ined.)]
MLFQQTIPVFLAAAVGYSSCLVAAFSPGPFDRRAISTTRHHVSTVVQQETSVDAAAGIAVPISSLSSSSLDNLSKEDEDYKTLLKTVQTRKVRPDLVFDSMLRLEKQSYRSRWTQTEDMALKMTQALAGNFRPIFSSGTPITQARLGGRRLNYFPIKAVISLLPEEGKIQNGLYVGDYYLIRLNGTCEYEPRLRRFRFSFHHMSFLNGAFKIDLQQGQDIEFATTVGLGGKIGLWNILLADQDMLMARGAGEAITLWKREHGHQAEWW